MQLQIHRGHRGSRRDPRDRLDNAVSVALTGGEVDRLRQVADGLRVGRSTLIRSVLRAHLDLLEHAYRCGE